MAHFFEKKDRHVIPNWRSFENTVKLWELNGSKSNNLVSNFKPDISDIIEDWDDTDNQTIGIAGDILGVALVSNQEANSKIIEVARFVMQKESIAPKALVHAAKTILKPSINKTIDLDINSIELFQDPTSLLILYKKINDLKKKLRDNPSNAINWIEIGRLYAIIGQTLKAQKSINNALFLASENRFVLRNSARFLVHTGEEGIARAHDIIRKSRLVRFDPWLLSTEIALATLRGRNSIFTKHGLQVVDSNSFHPFNITELASSLATIELKNSTVKKSRKLFEKSLINPNDNSLAQAEWASQEEHNLFELNSSQINSDVSFEAKARNFAENKDWNKAIEYSKKWFLDLPFSKGAILFGNNIALKKLKDHEVAANIGKLGLRSHPNDPHLLNNIIYSLCLQDKVEEAEAMFRLVNKEDLNLSSSTGVCLIATQGLLNYRKGIPKTGRKLYLEAMNAAKVIGNNSLTSVALVNMTREEIILGEENLSDVIPILTNVSKKTSDNDLKDEIKSVIDLYRKTEMQK
jgi:tetratricopeptide (TPR) repeat protein